MSSDPTVWILPILLLVDEKQQVFHKESDRNKSLIPIGILEIRENAYYLVLRIGQYRGCSKLATVIQSVQQHHCRKLGLV